MSKTIRAVGLMSGTSMDGIDMALIETDGEARVKPLAAASVAYPEAFRDRLRAGLVDARAIGDRGERPGTLAGLERELTERHAEALDRFLGDRMLQPSAIDVIGFHGQTVLHRPEVGLTVQIGDGAMLARMTGIDVIYDLRAADCAAGGQGAPLVPVYHRALAARIAERPLAIVNIGGVANVTWIGRDGTLVAFDTGPGNALIDDWILRHTGKPCDVDGAIARSGKLPTGDAFMRYLTAPYFERRVPKSLDRGDFPLSHVDGLSLEDGAQVLTHVTVSSIARAVGHFPEPPARWIITGGGRRNTYMMETLRWHLSQPMQLAEEVGLDGDALEAEAWAYLAVRSLLGLPITFPGTTGAPTAMTGGVLMRAN